MKIVDLSIIDLRHRHFPIVPMECMKKAISQFGIISSASVIPAEGWGYWIVNGHHRIKAARDLGYRTYPCAVLDPVQDDYRFEVFP
jgi:ParB-like chromosome segregation protein Spo0J